MPGNEALLQTYVYYIQEENMVKEMIFARHLMTDRKGESIFKVVDNFFQEKETLMHNIITRATDGAPAMVGRYRGFISCLKNAEPKVISVYCVYIEKFWSQNTLMFACTTLCISLLHLSVK